MVKVICNKCEKESNEKEVYCLSCYSEAINKIKELEVEIKRLEGELDDWEGWY